MLLLTLGFTKDSNMLHKLLCLLLCAVGAVVARNKCTTFGNVIDIDKACINSTFGSEAFENANSSYKLTLLCSRRLDYARCMQQNTAGCDEASDIRNEVIASFGVCETTDGADQWAATYLDPYLTYPICRGNTSVMHRYCTRDVFLMGLQFPFSNTPFTQGLATIHEFKRVYLSCNSEWFEASDNCQPNWRKSYLSLMLEMTVTNRHFGLFLESQDIDQLLKVHAEIEAQQAQQAQQAQCRQLCGLD